MNTKLIIFDFDGTLADTTATILNTYRMTIAEVGADSRSEAQCQATIGLPLREGFRQLYPDFSDEELDKCTQTYRRLFDINKTLIPPHLYPAVKDTLQQIAQQGIAMSIASSRSSRSLLEFCEICGIRQYFSLILGADNVVHAKPDPEPVLLTLERLNHTPEDSVVVGDMPVDIAMGSGAGCRTIGVSYGNSTAEDLIKAGADHVIDSFAKILDIVQA